MSTIPQSAIYTITNTTNGHVYIGQTVQKPIRRWGQHTSALRIGKHDNTHLQAAWNKYGESSFVFCVIDTCATIDDANTAECHYIAHFQSLGVILYNATHGGRNALHTRETKDKISAAHIGRKKSPEAAAKSAAARRGMKQSAERIAKTRAALIGQKKSPEAIKKTAAANRGKKRSPEAIEKSRIARIGTKQSPEWIEHTAAANRGKKRSPEARAKMAKTWIGRKHSEESKAKMRGPRKRKE